MPESDASQANGSLVTERYQSTGPETISEWVEQFHRDGYLFLPELLSPEFVERLRSDLDNRLTEIPLHPSAGVRIQERMFEHSPANVRLFDMEPMATFAESLIAPDCHVIHNNSFVTELGGGISTWHQDDAPHYLVLEGDAPKNVRLPVLLFTANYYLTDVLAVENGSTEVLPGSHLFGKPCPPDLAGTPYASRITPTLGKAGSVTLFNNQVWHRGGPNLSDTRRYITQVSYARRLVGHKYYPFMNYQMPEWVYADAGPRLKRLLGFLPHGAYG